MITVTRCSWAAGVVLFLTSLSAAGDSPAVAINSDRTTAPLRRDELPEHDRGRLETRRPYERGKVPVVFIHGLWGSPRNWDRMIEGLEADPALRTRFQFWTVGYASGDSIPYSAHLLRQSLRRTRRVFDPDGTDAAFDRMVVVGHSLGGILAKMMVPERRTAALADCLCTSNRPGHRTDRGMPAPATGILLQARARGAPGHLHRDPPSRQPTCQRPSSRAWYTALLAAQPVPPSPGMLLSHNEPDMFAPGFRGDLATSAGELAPGHPLLLRLCELGIDSSVRSHSVIADLRDPPKPDGTDGIVPYSSSHIDGVASELLVHGLHICVNHPAVIEEVRRILMEHATPACSAEFAGLRRLLLTL